MYYSVIPNPGASRGEESAVGVRLSSWNNLLFMYSLIMSDNPSSDTELRVPDSNERERIRQSNIAELKSLCDRIAAEAEARGLTEEILNEILNEELTAEESAICKGRAQKMLTFVAENRQLAEQRGLTDADVPRLIAETRGEL